MLAKTLTPLLAAIILAVIAAFGVWVQEPWLAPSLGSAIFTQVLTPDESSAKPFAIGIGQLLGAAAGFLAVFVAGPGAPPYMGGHTLVMARVLAILIAAALAASVQLATGAVTPAGGATALVVAIGAEQPDIQGAFHLVVGIMLVTVLGEAARQIILRARTRAQA